MLNNRESKPEKYVKLVNGNFVYKCDAVGGGGCSAIPCSACRMPSWTSLFIKTLLFPQRGSDPAYLASMYFMVLDASTVAAGANFCHTSLAKRLKSVWSPLFPKVGVRFCKCDFRPEFFKFAPRVWCDDSYGAAHRRIRGRQTCLQNQLNFNSFFCGVSAATKLPFSAPKSHSFLTRRVFHVVGGCRFFIGICMC